jgi:hypothetical protein
MSADIDSAAYLADHGVAWHGLGNPLTADEARDVDAIVRIAGLEWTVDSRPLSYQSASGAWMSPARDSRKCA